MAKGKSHRLFYIGRDFYIRSGTEMSPIYKEFNFERWDWGFVEAALERGDVIEIRPANRTELLWAEAELGRVTLR